VLRSLTSVNSFLGKSNYREGELLDRLLQFIQSEENKVALQVYALHTLTDFVKSYPEINIEIEAILANKQKTVKPAMKIAIRNHRNTIAKLQGLF
jgi:hypothetical protein